MLIQSLSLFRLLLAGCAACLLVIVVLSFSSSGIGSTLSSSGQRDQPAASAAALPLRHTPTKEPLPQHGSRHRLAVIVPFRNRFQQLQQLVPHLHRFLNRQNIDHQLFVVNQVDGLRFNRASLINTGYLLTRDQFDYMAMHDVDLLPLNEELSYAFPGHGTPMHLSSPSLHPKYHYDKFVGGILLITGHDYELVDGMSNRYYGWGLEDDEFYTRLMRARLQIRRPQGISTGTSDSFKHIEGPDSKRDTAKLFNQKEATRKIDRETGLHNLNYRLLSKSDIVIDSAPCTIFNVELICDYQATPWCDHKYAAAASKKQQKKQSASLSLPATTASGPAHQPPSAPLQPPSVRKHPVEEFSRHQVVEPILLMMPQRDKIISLSELKRFCPDELLLRFTAFNEQHEIELRRNQALLSAQYYEQHHDQHNGSQVITRPTNIHNHCHYTTATAGDGGWAAFSLTNGTVNGLLALHNDSLYVHYDAASERHLAFLGSELSIAKNCGVTGEWSAATLGRHIEQAAQRQKRSAPYGPAEKHYYKADLRTRYVELVIVNDNLEYKKNDRNKDIVIERSKQIANIVNALYNQLNVVVALQGIVVWSEFDEIALSGDGDATLTNFLNYRRERLIPIIANDNAQLITGTSFDGGVVGKALKGPMCTYEYSGGVNIDHSHVVGLVATTVAHEMGHNFGMEHDTEKCKCPDDKCIMAPSSSSVSPKHWSSCSREYIIDAFNHGMDHCLRNVPTKLYEKMCGNGFLDEGEECDCGLKAYCDSKCCNATTCKLMPGATCAVGPCCNKDTCTIVSAAEQKTCRPAISECDLEEKCDGIGEFCPRDVHAHNGHDCRADGYCYGGQCATYDSQCRLLWGPSGRVSDPKCFEQNTKGNVNGNCGFHRTNASYTPCAHQDMLCGMLHCTHNNDRLEYGMESAAILSRSFIPTRGNVLACRSAIIDLGLDSRDPGLVPNGAKCAADKLCVNQKCIPLSVVLADRPCPDNCSSNGICDNEGRCHCFGDYAEPNCLFLVPKYHRFTVAMYIIFCFILPLTAIAAVIIYYYHGHIKTWFAIKARQSSLKSRAKQSVCRKHPRHQQPGNSSGLDLRTLEISEPIPIGDGSESTTAMTSSQSSSITLTSLGATNNQAGPPLPFVRTRPKALGAGPNINPNNATITAAATTILSRDTRSSFSIDKQPRNPYGSFISHSNSQRRQAPAPPAAATTTISHQSPDQEPMLLQPLRRAPPPPGMAQSVTSGTIGHSLAASGLRSSTRSNHSDRARPNCPPPRPPVREQVMSDLAEAGGGGSSVGPVLNFENTRLAFVHDSSAGVTTSSNNTLGGPKRPTNGGRATPDLMHLSSLRNGNGSHGANVGQHHANSSSNLASTRVAALTKRFQNS